MAVKHLLKITAMKRVCTLLCFLLYSFAISAQQCDSITIQFTTFPSLDGPLSVEYDVEYECTDSALVDEEHFFLINDTTLGFTLCLNAGEYRARARCNNCAMSETNFSVSVTHNGTQVTPSQTTDWDTDEVRYYFVVQEDCDNLPEITSVRSENEAGFNVFPSPITDQVVVEHPLMADGGCLVLTNAEGAVMREFDVHDRRMTIDTSFLPAGMYYFIFRKGKSDALIATYRTVKLNR
jgi:hypothetical protein